MKKEDFVIGKWYVSSRWEAIKAAKLNGFSEQNRFSLSERITDRKILKELSHEVGFKNTVSDDSDWSSFSEVPQSFLDKYLPQGHGDSFPLTKPTLALTKDLIVGKWYSYGTWSPFTYAKFLYEENDPNKFYFSEAVHDSFYSGNKSFFYLSRASLFTEASQEALSKFLPKNHPDLNNKSVREWRIDDAFQVTGEGVYSSLLRKGRVYYIVDISKNKRIRENVYHTSDKKGGGRLHLGAIIDEFMIPYTEGELPEKWVVRVHSGSESHPELSKWRSQNTRHHKWYDAGFINSQGHFDLYPSLSDSLISEEDFIKLVYNPLLRKGIISPVIPREIVLRPKTPEECYSPEEIQKTKESQIANITIKKETRVRQIIVESTKNVTI